MSTRLSIVIATHNRLSDLTRGIEALAKQPLLDACEVLIVDSASDPACREGIEALAARMPHTRALRLDLPGVARARNLGAQQARAEWFATLDDDAIPDPHWLASALALCGSVPRDVGIIQGRVNPLWPVAAEPALGRLWKDYLSILQLGPAAELQPCSVCVGANMLVRRATWEQIGGYDIRFGRTGNSLASGIDSALGLATQHAGYHIVYSDRLAVLHSIHADRLSRSWIARRARMEGRAQATVVRRSSLRRVALGAKLAVAIPALHVLSQLYPTEDDYLVRKYMDIGMLQSLLMLKAND
jgi:GT2 family glycosyltransferase